MSKKIYIGPTIDGVAIKNTVYEKLPQSLEAAIKKRPYLSGLCIPIAELANATRQINGRNGAAYKIYTKALEERAEIMKGANQ